MILVDTSVWIDLLSRRPTHRLKRDQMPQLVTTGVIIQEVVQGASSEETASVLEADMLALQRVADPMELALFRAASRLYRLARRRGYTVRSSTDCLIAAIAIENPIAVWHDDRDFDALAKVSELEVHRGVNLPA